MTHKKMLILYEIHAAQLTPVHASLSSHRKVTSVHPYMCYKLNPASLWKDEPVPLPTRPALKWHLSDQTYPT